MGDQQTLEVPKLCLYASNKWLYLASWRCESRQRTRPICCDCIKWLHISTVVEETTGNGKPGRRAPKTVGSSTVAGAKPRAGLLSRRGSQEANWLSTVILRLSECRLY